MQATSSKRFVRSRAGGMVVALGVLLVSVIASITIVLASAGEQGGTSPLLSASGTNAIQFDQNQFLEENVTWQIPYLAPPTLSYHEIRYIEDNTTFQTPYFAPSLSYEEIRLWEDNTWGYHTESADTR